MAKHSLLLLLVLLLVSGSPHKVIGAKHPFHLTVGKRKNEGIRVPTITMREMLKKLDDSIDVPPPADCDGTPCNADGTCDNPDLCECLSGLTYYGVPDTCILRDVPSDGSSSDSSSSNSSDEEDPSDEE